MTTTPWHGLLLALAIYRLLRFLAWDTFPPVAHLRAWVLGEQIVTTGSPSAMMGITADAPEQHYRYRRPLLAEMVHCPFCFGLWLSIGAYLAWLKWPEPMMYAAMPLALSAVVGLVSKNWDA